MNKEDLLTLIAETAYNVGFGAKKHFATFDLVDQAPRIIGFSSMAAAIFALIFDPLSTKIVSATFIVFGVLALYIAAYESQKNSYNTAGVKLTQLLNELKRLHMSVKAADGEKTQEFLDKLQTIEDEYYASSITKQILFSDWLAHYKFFWQHQVSWIDQQIQFRLLRDKIPLSFTITTLILAVALALWVCGLPSLSCCFWKESA